MLLVLVEADYKVRYVDVGCNGRVSDGGVFKNSSLFRAITENTINLPNLSHCQGQRKHEASPFKPYLSKAYPARTADDRTRIYNYRLSRGRRIVANAFGIPASGFGVLKSQLHWIPQKQSLLS